MTDEFGRDKAPLVGGGCNHYTYDVITHRAFRLEGTVAQPYEVAIDLF